MSGGTMLALAADEIVMDANAVLSLFTWSINHEVSTKINH